MANLQTLAAGVGAALAGAYLVDYQLGIRHDLKMAKAGAKTLQYLLDREAEGKASTVEPFITTARDPKTKDRQFLMFEDYSATFAQADEETNRLTQLLVARGVKPGDVVAICFENSPQAIYAQLAVWKAGAAVAFLNFNLRGNNLLHTVRLGKGRHLLFEDRVMEAIQSIADNLDRDVELLCYGFSVPSSVPANVQAFDSFKAFDAATLAAEFPDGNLDPGLELRRSIKLNSFSGIYMTSGTTGLPKAAYQIHNRLRTFPTAVNVGLDYLGRDDRIFCPLPLYHGAAQVSLNVCCMSGGCYIFTRKFSASNFWAEAIRTRATAFQHIGESARYIWAVPPSPLDRKHNVTKGIGVGLRPDIWVPFMQRFGIKEMFEWYGQSEGVAGIFHVQSGRDGAGTVGRLGYLARRAGNIKIVKVDLDTEQIVRDQKTGFAIECGAGEPGEILGKILGPEASPIKASNFDGYYGNKEATEKKIRRDVFEKGDAWMAMGDLLSIDRRGWVRFHDRIGDTFRWNGENVATTEVAQELSDSDEITEINVYGVSVPGRDGRAGMAAVRLREGVDASPSNVREVMKRLGALATKKLPGYAIPRFVRIMPEIEITGTFKQRKVDLVKAGFDPRTVTDPLFWYNPSSKTYEPLGVAEFNTIVAGKARL